MSDLGADAGSSSSAPPPPVSSSLPPPPAYAPIGPVPAGWVPATAATQKPPRPPVPVGSVLLIVGGVAMFVSAFLTWYSVDGEPFGGWEDNVYAVLLDEPQFGALFLMLGLVAIGFGIAQLAARRVLSVAILAVVFSGLGFFSAVAALSNLSEFDDRLERLLRSDLDVSIGAGPFIALLGAAIAVAGAVATLARRRRWPVAVPA